MGRGGGGWDLSEPHLCSAGLSFSPHALGWDGVGAAPSPPPIPGQGPRQPTCLPHRLEAREPYIPGRTEATKAEKGMGRGQHTTEVRGQGWEAHPRPDHTLRGGYSPHGPRLGTEPL